MSPQTIISTVDYMVGINKTCESINFGSSSRFFHHNNQNGSFGRFVNSSLSKKKMMDVGKINSKQELLRASAIRLGYLPSYSELYQTKIYQFQNEKIKL